MRQKIANNLLLLAVFLLPFQTQWIISESLINGLVSEYGKISIYLVEVLFVVVLLLRGRIRLIAQSEKVTRHLYFISAAGFFSLTTALLYNVALFQIGHVLIAGIVFVILLDERTVIKNLLYAFVLGLILPCVIGWYQFFSGSSPSSTLFGLASKQVLTPGVAVVENLSSRSLRAYGTFFHPNIFGGYLAIGILFLAWLIRFVKDRWHLVCMIVLTVLFSSTLIITFSRSAWLALSVSLLVLILQMFFYKKILPKKAYPIIVFGFLTIVLNAVVFGSSVLARFQPSLRVEAISVQERFSQYQYVDKVIKIRLVTGVGIGNYVFALSKIYPDQPVWAYQPVHNSILLFISEIGLLGMFAFIYWFSTYYKSIKTVFKKPSGIFFFVFCTAFLILALFDHYLWSFWSGLVLFSFSFACVFRWCLNDKKVDY